MLQKPGVHTKRILDLADFIEQLEPERFSMQQWGVTEEPRCICGWLLHNNAYINKMDWQEAARLLGLDDYKANILFGGGLTKNLDNKTAASVLRHLAVTGELKV